ncbi:hypothetical protein L3Y21_gp077 [Gordonia phage Rabbitrun]|uniref:DUF6378 domain-containing protein n=1 Tax=Gordonia phage Rabbitrun TaxID=2762280 RepID=A0A7G8LIP6_9CAUD|nr:hypothetical protein L3Y21_gp077 [Gordonia phage Rabbitrun]QNJ57118.1 hypothetical protein SEA_RABBITRUN_77 [Gordonia phage Rabbitrun]
MSDLLKEADHIVSGDRAGDYGENSLPAIARLWSEHVGSEITARDVAWMMVLLKSVRDRHKEKRDNLVDAIGYIQLAEVNTTPEPVKVQGEMIIPAAEALSPNGQNLLKAINEAEPASRDGFKVGDRVKVVAGFKSKIGRTGEVLDIDGAFIEVSDANDSDGSFPYTARELAHVTE